MPEPTCDFCGEPIEDKDGGIRRGDRVYCCEACAFEATRSKDCTGRTDSVMKDSMVESSE